MIWNEVNPIVDLYSAYINSVLSPFNPAGFIKRATHEGKATFASGHPTNLIVTGDIEKKKKEILPSFLNPMTENNYRLYSADQIFNIWWNALYPMPLSRGYLDPPIENDKRGYHFWLDAALNVDPNHTDKPLLTSEFKYPQDIAFNNALFLVDWNAILYLQGGSSSPYPGNLNKLIDSEEVINKKETIPVDNLLGVKSLFLQYYQVKSELTSPIISTTNVPVVGIFASEFGYETIIRSLAALNLDSKWVIPIKLGKSIDKYPSSTLSQFDLLILYDYNYSNSSKAFKSLFSYIEKGGKILIDSGVETKESVEGHELPGIFPVDKIKRKGIGEDWDLNIENAHLKQEVDTSEFSPTVFDESEWKFSIPDGDIRDGANILATNHKNPILMDMKIGKGLIVWTGINLSYHIARYNNIQEALFYKNILSSLIPLKKEEVVGVDFNWSNPRKIIVNGASGGKGLLIKEQLFPGWVARSKAKNLTIWPTGPAIPGYMYIFLPSDNGGKDIVITYNGSLTVWLLSVVTFITILIILDYVLLGGILVRLTRRLYIKSVGKGIKKWWEKEDEEV